MSTFKKLFGALVIIFAWMALLLSPLGNYVAGVSILVLIVILFVCGCIEVQTTSRD
ncbi:MAG: hypothetical protein P8X55_10895 [Desulfosarcinaceae bacterium]